MASLIQRLLARISCLAFAALPLSAAADSPAGQTFTISLGGPNSIIVLDALETNDATCVDDPDLGEICVELSSALDLVQDARGRVNGSARFEFSATGELPGLSIVGVFEGPVTGRIRGGRGGRALQLRNRLQGEARAVVGGLDLDETFEGSAVASLRGQVSDDGFVTGQQRVSIRLDTLGGQSQTVDIAQALPGVFEWDVTLAVEDVGTPERERLVAEADVTLGSGEILQLASPLRYNARRDFSNVGLRARNAGSQGASLRIQKLVVSSDGEITGGTVRYRIAGQSGSATLAP